MATESKSINLIFLDGKGKSMSISLKNPKTDLTKEVVDTAAKQVIDSHAFATPEGGDLVSLKSAKVITRNVNTVA